MIGNSGIVQQFLEDILLFDQDFHLMAIRLEPRDDVLVIIEMGGMAEIDENFHFASLW